MTTLSPEQDWNFALEVFFALSEMMFVRDLNKDCSCIRVLVFQKKASLSVPEWLGLHSRMSTICQAASACPGSVQAHFPL